MNIAFIRRHWSPTGGAENYLLRLVTQLKERGCCATLFCESWDRPPTPFDRIVTLPSTGSSFYRPVQFAHNCEAALLVNTFDLVFSMERGIKADIYRAGDGVHRAWLQLRQRAKPLRGFLQNKVNLKNVTLCQLEKRTFQANRTRCVIANSEMVKQDILTNFDYPATHIKTILNGVDFPYFSSGNRRHGRHAMEITPEALVVLLVGSGTERKGHAVARKIMEPFSAKAQLVIIDSPPACAMPDVYAAADIFLFPTLYDPFANVTLEAMAAGLPVITTRHNGASQLIEHGKNGFLVEDNSKLNELTAHVEALLDKSLRKRVGIAGRQTAQEWTLEKNVAATLELMENMQKSE
jgi:UDP-glucose:(heptosyl)LPS alpha-1,3-glucosyltransferase